MKRVALLAILGFALFSVSCSGGGGGGSVLPGPTPTPTAKPATTLYVANAYAANPANRGKIMVYGLPVSSVSAPNVTILTGDSASALESFAFDSTYTYVSDCSDHIVRAFVRPITSTSLAAFAFVDPAGPDGLVADRAGNLYAANDCTPVDSINVFAPPISAASTASVSVSDPANISSVQQEAVVGAQLYVAQCASSKQLLVYTLPLINASTAAVALTINPSDACESGVAYDPMTNQIFVASGSINKIYAFTLPVTAASTPALTITTATGGRAFNNIAFDGAGNLYATDFVTAGIDVFVPPFSASSNPAFSLHPAGIDDPWGLAIGP